MSGRSDEDDWDTWTTEDARQEASMLAKMDAEWDRRAHPGNASALKNPPLIPVRVPLAAIQP